MNEGSTRDVFAELRRELAVTPSPDFAARAREKIAAPPPSSTWRVWPLAVSAAAAGLLWVWAGASKPAPSTPAAARSVAAERAEAAPIAEAPQEPRRSRDDRADQLRQPPIVRAAATTERTPRPEPEVLVPPDAMHALDLLRERLRDGTLNATNMPAGWGDTPVPTVARPDPEWQKVERPWPDFLAPGDLAPARAPEERFIS